MSDRNRARRRRVVAATLGGVLVAAGVAGFVPSRADTVSCVSAATAPNSWEQLGAPIGTPFDPNADVDQYRLVVDPWQPCLAYRIVGDAGPVERTVDEGRTWNPVYSDDRRAADGTPLRITGLYVPAPGTVYLSEVGNGTSVMRSLDAGVTWAPANAGLEGSPIQQLWFAPSDGRVAYAVSVSGGSGPNRLGGTGTLFATRDGGTTWHALPAGRYVNTEKMVVGVDPADAAHVYVVVRSLGYLPGTTLLESHDFGTTFGPATVLDNDVQELLVARRPSNALRLYRIANGATPPGLRYSDDNGSTWKGVEVKPVVKWAGALLDPIDNDKVFYFGRPQFQSSSDLLSLFTRNGFVDQEFGAQPPPLTRSYELSRWGVDRQGRFYVHVGLPCNGQAGCRVEGVPVAEQGHQSPWRSWRTLRFRPPEPGQAFVLGTAPDAAPPRTGQVAPWKQCTDVAAQPPEYPRSEPDDSGTMAFDGARLYYTRRAERGPGPLSAVVRIVDPASCQETGQLVVQFDEAVYREARRRALSDVGEHEPMLPEQPSIDSLAYDSVHDELWFSVTRAAPAAGPFSGTAAAPYPVWSVPRSGAGGVRQARLRLWTEPCGYGGVGLLSHDRASDTLWTCNGKVPGELEPTGRPRPTCLHPLFAGSAAKGDDVRNVLGWGVGRPGTLIALLDDSNRFPPRRFEQFDARTCTHTDTWSVLATDYVATPRQENEWVSTQPACDAVTFRSPSGGQAPPAAVFWMRSGPRFVAFRAPNLSCPSPTAVGYSGVDRVDPGSRLDACATVTVVGPAAPLSGVPVRISVAGGPEVPVTTDAAGRACMPYQVAVDAVDGSRLPVRATVAEDAHLLGSVGTGSVLVGRLPEAAAAVVPTAVVASTPGPPPLPGVFLPAPAPAPASPAAAQGATSPPAQTVAQQGISSEKEREVQLAHAQQETGRQEQPAEQPSTQPAERDDGYAMVTVTAVVAFSALALRGAGRVAPSRSLAPAASLTASLTASGRPSRRRRRRGPHRRR